ncbi:Pre-rRNA-processing protein IPI1/Testis-expressed sequence 10 protein, partial [Thalictrum thalictroides]
AFTEALKACRPESSLKLACVSAIEEMLLPSNRYDTHILDTNEKIRHFQTEWMHELPPLLVQLGDRHCSSSKVSTFQLLI